MSKLGVLHTGIGKISIGHVADRIEKVTCLVHDGVLLAEQLSCNKLQFRISGRGELHIGARRRSSVRQSVVEGAGLVYCYYGTRHDNMQCLDICSATETKTYYR